MSDNIKGSVKKATKWSVITEATSKLINPISTMVLARLLAPEAFGVLVTALMVISFAQIFTDAGFQKYIVQHDFDDDDALFKSVSVAFWSNLIFSFFVWFIIILFSPQIAYLVGNEGYGLVIAVSCVCIPIAAFSSIQMAVFKRKFDFKTLFGVRIVGIAIPLVITIPLAFLTHSYWSLIIGMIAQNVSNAIILTWKSVWKPRWFYSVALFKEMFSFTVWSMIESISIWLTNYIDLFIIGTVLSTYYLGIYRTGTHTVTQIMDIITLSTAPVLFSALSRLQNNFEEFKRTFFLFQRYIALLVIPMGVGIFLFSDLLTAILLGDQWKESSYIISWWGLTSAITIVLSHFCSEIYRSKGKPQYSVLVQILHLCFLVPTVLISVDYGFDCLCLSRSLVRLTCVVINLLILYKLTRISLLSMLRNISHSCIGSIVMLLVFLLLPEGKSIPAQIVNAVICAVVYLGIIGCYKEERGMLLSYISKIRKKTNL